MRPSVLCQFGGVYLNFRCYSVIHGGGRFLQIGTFPQNGVEYILCKKHMNNHIV